MIVITKVGNTGRAARVHYDGRTFDVRTRSRRAYAVVDSHGNILRRTDNGSTAWHHVNRVPGSFRIAWAELNRVGEVTIR